MSLSRVVGLRRVSTTFAFMPRAAVEPLGCDEVCELVEGCGLNWSSAIAKRLARRG